MSHDKYQAYKLGMCQRNILGPWHKGGSTILDHRQYPFKMNFNDDHREGCSKLCSEHQDPKCVAFEYTWKPTPPVGECMLYHRFSKFHHEKDGVVVWHGPIFLDDWYPTSPSWYYCTTDIPKGGRFLKGWPMW